MEIPIVDRHDPALYEYDALAEPVDGLGSVGDAQVDFFREHGFLAVKDVFSVDQVARGLDGLNELAMGDPAHVQFEPSYEDHSHEMDPEERLGAIRKFMFFVSKNSGLHSLAYDEPLLAVVRRLVGADELEMFQDMALIKPPRIGSEKPWHQDMSYFDVVPGTPVVGVWIALDPVTTENGCMRVLDGGHHEGPQIHFNRRDWQICDSDVEKLHSAEHAVIAVPLSPGGCLFFSGLLPHGTPHNDSDRMRRALQFHYRSVGVSSTTTDERLAVFGSEGKDVEC